MTTREKFVARFGEEQAVALERAAEEHKNGVHDNPGSDHFRWVICICIGFQCAEVDSYRKCHDITVNWEELKQWIKEEANLAKHDGDVCFISLALGKYNEFMPEGTAQ